MVRRTLVASTTVVIGLILVGGLVTSGIGAASQAGDDYPAECDKAPTVNSTGIITGIIDSPRDRDSIRYTIPKKGDYVTTALMVPSAEARLELLHEGPKYMAITMANTSEFLRGGTSVAHPIDAPHSQNGSWEVWSELARPITVCVTITEQSPENANIPYEYAIGLGANSPDAVTLSDKLDQLQQMLDERNETIAQLRNNTTTTG